MFRPVDLKIAADRLTACADKLAAAGVEFECDIADTGLALTARGGSVAARPAEVVPMAHIFIHEKDELAAAADRLIRKVEALEARAAA